MGALHPPVRLRCIGRQGARVRTTEDLASAYVCDIAKGDVVVGVREASIVTKGRRETRVLIESQGWVSRKCFVAEAAALPPPRPPCHARYHVVVIGAGPLGLACAALCKRRGLGVTVLEKQASLGGDWRKHGNAWSELQTHKAGYLIGEPRDPAWSGLPSYPGRSDMLKYFADFASLNGLDDDIVFDAEYVERSRVDNRGTMDVRYSQGGRELRTLEATHVFAAPGRVNVRRDVTLPGEDDFGGVVAYGNGGDLSGVALENRRVVILGAGSFALENMRHALLAKARAVTLVARDDQLVLSKAASYMIDRNADAGVPRDAVIAGLAPAYALLGRGEAWLRDLVNRSSRRRTTTPTSDLYFLALATGAASQRKNAVRRLEPGVVVLENGERLAADVVLKCFGFGRDTDLDARVVWPAGERDGRTVEDGWWNRFVDDGRRVFLTSSTANESFVPKPGDHWPGNVFMPAGTAEIFLSGAAGFGEPGSPRGVPTAWDRAARRHGDRTRTLGPTDAALLAELAAAWDDYAARLGVAPPRYPYAAVPGADGDTRAL